jgi:UDP-glucose 4-epimerase
MKKIAVTGPTGFVGHRLMAYDRDRYDLIPVLLRETEPEKLDLRGITTVVHLAGKAHEMKAIDEQVYFDVNYELTRRLADRARSQGVAQFVYISSTKVYGDDIRTTLNEQSPCHPTDAYGASKLKAEQYLQSVSDASFKVAIIRPPLIYGPGVKGNMLRLLQLADKRWPLPFGNSANARSMVFIDNLIELINTIVEQQAAGIFVAGDRAPLSTGALIRLIRKRLGNPARLVNVPGIVLKSIQKIKPALYIRLFGSFVADNQATNRQLNFVPPYTTEEGIGQMTDWFRNYSK